jgi:hypothetical protein
MPVIDLENLELANGQRRLSVLRARLDVSWPEGCVRLDVRQQQMHAWVMLSVDVPKDESPIRQGGLWQLRVSRQGRRFALDLLAASLDAVEAAKCRFRRIHRWTMAVVGFTADPLDWFPKPRFLRAAPDQDILADLAAFLREDPSLGAVEAVTFTSEGGWHSGSGS